MFCPKCGSEVIEEANFCPDCGANLKPESAVGTRIQTADSNETAAETQDAPNPGKTTGLKKTVKHSLKLSHRTARTIILITLVLALGSSIAYAAFYVYQNVYLPSQQNQTGNEETIKRPQYGTEVKSMKVSVPDMTENYKSRTEEEWHYELLTCSQENEPVEKINKAVKNAMKAKAANAEKQDQTKQDEGLIECVLNKTIQITQITEKYVCFIDSSTVSNGGAIVWNESPAAYFSLETGESVTPSEALGIPSKKLTEMSKKAVRTYLEKNPISDSFRNMDEANDEVVDRTSADTNHNELGITSHLASSNKGLFYITNYGELRYGYEYACIVVDPFSKKLKPGDTVETMK